MKKVVLMYIYLFFLFISNCDQTKNQFVDVKVSENNQYPIIRINSHNLKEPLKFSASPDRGKGSFYFKTENGKKWVRGNPESKSEKSNVYNYSWKVNSRKINLKINRDNDNFIIKFSAEPQKGILGWGLNLNASENEYFTGLFERTVDGTHHKSWERGITESMNLRGQKVDMIIKPTLSLYAPFYISSRGYGMHIYGTWPGEYDLCKEVDDLVQIYFDGPVFKCCIYTRKKPAEIVKAHTLEFGPPILPPKWVFSHWRWRDNHKNQKTYYDGTHVAAPYNSMVVEDILMMKALDIPSGVYWIDRPWATGPMGYDDFEWDQKRFPKYKEMIKWLNREEKKILLWIAPWVDGTMAETARARDFTVDKHITHWNKDADKHELALLDFTNPKAVEWWQNEGLTKVLKQGVKGFKLDRSEELVPDNRNQRTYDGRTNREVRNNYPVEYVKATYEITKEIHGDDFVLMPRAGYTGSSRYAVFWGGDVAAHPEGLRSAIISLLRSSIIGYPFWGSDIGGYHGDLDREVTSRWLAFGAFCPIMEVGPTEDRGLWDLEKKPNYDPQIIAIWRFYAQLHTKFMDYSYQQAKLAQRTGMPVARPLFMEYPDQKQAREDWQTYLYGPDILVSPIWQKGKEQHTFYLPAGNKWIDAWDKNKTYEGGQKITVDTPLHKIPIFIKQGSTLNIGNLEKLFKESLDIARDKPNIKQLEKNADFIKD